METFPREREVLNNVPGFKLVMIGTFSDAHKCFAGHASEDALGITIPWGTIVECDHCGQKWEWLRRPTRREFNWQKFRWDDIIGEPYWREYGSIWMF